MSHAVFDTLEAAVKLEKSGIEREQAMTFVSVIRDANSDANLATKQDLKDLKLELNHKMDGVRTELKEDMHALDKKIDTKFNEVVLMLAKQETSLTEKLVKQETRLIIRLGAIIIGTITLIVGAQTILQYFLPK